MCASFAFEIRFDEPILHAQKQKKRRESSPATRCFKAQDLSSALLTATLLAASLLAATALLATLFFALALLALTFLSVAIFLLAALLSRSSGFVRLVRIALRFHSYLSLGY